MLCCRKPYEHHLDKGASTPMWVSMLWERRRGAPPVPCDSDTLTQDGTHRSGCNGAVRTSKAINAECKEVCNVANHSQALRARDAAAVGRRPIRPGCRRDVHGAHRERVRVQCPEAFQREDGTRGRGAGAL